MNQAQDWKLQETVIAIATDKPGEWIYSTYPNWNEARKAVNSARSQGKAAVIYDGACPPTPPDFSLMTRLTMK
ncbi:MULTISPECIES: hypothetical protein [unclassified Coleofasciculus]|uniref:hypothetical protein n=1 Tax=Cyanophyceae TaxID=3028117 RepID=UPI00168339D0|nr:MULTISPECIES: hypothetical protein [unclassified Coleofasciculus]MBD1880261.1 hypothetical protein [Coleofasciculus sp. FACHB-T130]MBD1898654.1 hypothetical protein [Coleofasciculus sp. FACHB-125]